MRGEGLATLRLQVTGATVLLFARMLNLAKFNRGGSYNTFLLLGKLMILKLGDIWCCISINKMSLRQMKLTQ